MLTRTCRACGIATTGDGLRTCPCGASYGPIAMGYDRDPDAHTAAETPAEWNRRHEREEQTFLASERTRLADVTNRPDDGPE